LKYTRSGGCGLAESSSRSSGSKLLVLMELIWGKRAQQRGVANTRHVPTISTCRGAFILEYLQPTGSQWISSHWL